MRWAVIAGDMFKWSAKRSSQANETYREVHSSDSESLESDEQSCHSLTDDEPVPILKSSQRVCPRRRKDHPKKVTWLDGTNAGTGQEPSEHTARPGKLSPEDLAPLKVADLKLLLKERHLPVSGKKDILVGRLMAYSDGNEDLIARQLMRKSKNELKDLLKSKGLRHQGNKQLLVDRLLGREVEVQSRRRIDKWEKSKARKLLLEMLRDERSRVHKMQANEVYESHKWFQDYPLANFKRYFEDMKAAAQKYKEKADRDNAIISMELKKFPRNRLTNRGYPFWDTHPASRWLRIDIEAGKDKTTSPNELRMTRDEYRVFPLKVFRDHIYQERRRVLETNLKVVQRNKKALKNHLAEVRRNKTSWDKIAMDAEVEEAISGLTQLNI